MYVRPVLRRAGKRSIVLRPAVAAAATAACALALGACSGGDESPDVDEPAGSFPVEVTSATFPGRQRVSLTSDLVLTVRNTGDEAVPELAVTVWTGDADLDEPKPEKPFAVLADDARAGDRARSVWVPTPGFPKVVPEGSTASELPDTGPAGGADAAQTDTFTFGALPAGASRTMVWRVTAVRAGRQRLNYAVAAGVSGGARAVDPDGAVPTGSFPVRITEAPEGCVVTADGPGEDC